MGTGEEACLSSLHPEIVGVSPATAENAQKYETSDQTSPEFSIKLLASELYKQGSHPPGGDKTIGTFCLSVLNEIENEGPFLDLINDFVKLRPVGGYDGMTPSEAAGTLRAVVSSDQLMVDENFPKGLDTMASWIPALHSIADIYDSDDATPRSEQLVTNLWARKVSTNIPTRYGPVELLMQGLKERFKDGIEWLDIGAGIGLGPNQLIMKELYPIPPIRVAGVNDDIETSQSHPPTELMIKSGQLLRNPSIIKNCVMIDPWHPNDPMNHLWARSSLRFYELVDDNFMRRFNDLANEKPSNVTAIDDKYSEGEGFSVHDEIFPKNQYDFITIITAAHQMPKKSLQGTIETAKEKASANAIIYLQDFAYKQRNGLNFYKHWHEPWRTRGYVLDMAGDDSQWQEVVRAYDSRCNALHLQMGKLIVKGAQKTFEEVILEAET